MSTVGIKGVKHIRST